MKIKEKIKNINEKVVVSVIMIVAGITLIFAGSYYTDKLNVRESFPGYIVSKQRVLASGGSEMLYLIIRCDRGFNYTITTDIQTYALHEEGDRISFKLSPLKYGPDRDIDKAKIYMFLTATSYAIGVILIIAFIVNIFCKD